MTQGVQIINCILSLPMYIYILSKYNLVLMYYIYRMSYKTHAQRKLLKDETKVKQDPPHVLSSAMVQELTCSPPAWLSALCTTCLS